MRLFLKITLLLFINATVLGQRIESLKGFGQWTDDFINAIASDKFGNYYIAGKYDKISLSKFSSENQLLWKVENSIEISDIAIDSKQNVYAIRYDNQTLSLTKYNLNGQIIWEKQSNKPQSFVNFLGLSLAISPTDEVYLTGASQSEFEFLGQKVYKNKDDIYSNHEVFLYKISENGDFIWLNVLGGVQQDLVYDVACASNGEIFIAANFRGEVKFVDKIVETISTRDMLLCFMPDGKMKWYKAYPASIRSLGTNSKNELVFSGIYNRNVLFDDIPATSKSTGIFWGMIDSNGNLKNIKKVVDVDENQEPQIAVSPKDEVFITGTINKNSVFAKDIEFVNESLGSDVFVIKYNDSAYPQFSQIIKGSLNEKSPVINYNNTSKRIFMGGVYNSLTLSSGGNSIKNNSGNSDDDVFITGIVDEKINICPSAKYPFDLPTTKLCEGDSSRLFMDYDYLTNSELSSDFGLKSFKREVFLSKKGNYNLKINEGRNCNNLNFAFKIGDKSQNPEITVYLKPSKIDVIGKSQICKNEGKQIYMIDSTNKNIESITWSLNGGNFKNLSKFRIESDWQNSGKVSLINTNPNGCTTTTDVNIQLNVIPTFKIIGSAAFCNPATYFYTINDNQPTNTKQIENRIFGGSISSSTSNFFQVNWADSTKTGRIISKLTNTFGCSNYDTLTVKNETITLNVVAKDDSLIATTNKICSFRWVRDTEVFQTMLNPSLRSGIKMKELGNYYVLAYNSVCNLTSKPYKFVILSNTEEATPKVSFYPNPVVERLMIELPENYIGAKIKVLDLSGKTLHEHLADSKKIEISSNHLPSFGLIRVESGKNLIVYRFTK